MTAPPTDLALDPAWALTRPVPSLEGWVPRFALRALLAATCGTVRIEQPERIVEPSDPTLFALSHHGSYEAILAPAALLAVRGGRPLHFLVDWMFLELPLIGWLIRRVQPIAVYRKRARWRWREARRIRGLSGPSPMERALEVLDRGGSVGIYPEGRRNPDPRILLPLRQGLARLALRSGAPVVPVGIDFPVRDRLGRNPRVGKMILRPGEPISFPEERRAWRDARRRSSDAARALERELCPVVSEVVGRRLARLARKVHLPKEPNR